MVAIKVKDKKIYSSIFFKFFFAGISILIVLLLFFNLFTPERVKNLNYVKYLQNRPQIVSEELKGKVDCSYVDYNPAYTSYMQGKRIEQIAIYKQTQAYKNCITKYSQRDEIIQDYYCLSDYKVVLDSNDKNAPVQTITISKTCEKKIGEVKWFKVFGKKIFIVKKTMTASVIGNKYDTPLVIGCFIIVVGLVGLIIGLTKKS